MSSVAPAQPRARTRLARAERREQIIDAAAAVLDGRDPADVTFEEIADAAGVSRALLYNYFGDRHGLIEAMYLRGVTELDARLGDATARATGMRELVENHVRAHMDFAHSQPVLYRYAAGQVRFARFGELQRTRVAQFTRDLGGNELSRILALGVGNSMYQMVLATIDHPDVERESAVAMITAFLHAALKAARPIAQPRQAVPAPS